MIPSNAAQISLSKTNLVILTDQRKTSG